MNGRNRPISYRRKRQTKRTVITVLIVLGIVLSILFVGFVIVGNRMLRRVENTPKDEEKPTDSTVSELPDYVAPPSIRAYPVLAETTDTTTFYARMIAAKEKGADAISLPLTDASGNLLYKSATATSLGLQIDSPYRVTVSSLVEQAGANKVYVSGIYVLKALQTEDDLLRSVALAQNAAILAEAFRAGINDVMLYAPSMTSDQTDELLRFVEQIRALAPNASIGLSLPSAILSGADADTLVAKLAPYFNYLALDVTNAGENDAAEFVDAQVHSSQNQYRFLYYGMRLLLPAGADGEEEGRIVDAANRNGVKSWQILPSVCVEQVKP